MFWLLWHLHCCRLCSASGSATASHRQWLLLVVAIIHGNDGITRIRRNRWTYRDKRYSQVGLARHNANVQTFLMSSLPRNTSKTFRKPRRIRECLTAITSGCLHVFDYSEAVRWRHSKPHARVVDNVSEHNNQSETVALPLRWENWQGVGWVN